MSSSALPPRSGGEFELDAGQFRTKFAPTGQSVHDGATTSLQGSYGLALPGAGFLRFGLDASHHNPTNRAGLDQCYPNSCFAFLPPTTEPVTFHAVSYTHLTLPTIYSV